jgi:hypothetical protein
MIAELSLPGGPSGRVEMVKFPSLQSIEVE